MGSGKRYIIHVDITHEESGNMTEEAFIFFGNYASDDACRQAENIRLALGNNKMMFDIYILEVGAENINPDNIDIDKLMADD